MSHDVIIVGAGPAGLSLARSLADTGLDIVIVEQQSKATLVDPAFDGRDIALTHRSVRYLRELGAWSRIPADDISPIREARVLDGASPYFLHFDHREVRHDALGYLVSNHLIRKSLFEEVTNRSDVSLLTEVKVTAVDLDNTTASVTLSNGETLKARLVVAADSRFSELRRKAGISAGIRDFGHSVIVSRMEHEQPHRHIAHECFYYGKTLALLPVTGNRSSIVITVPNNKSAEIMDMSNDEFGETVSEWFQQRLGGMKSITRRYLYPLVAVHADRFVTTRFALIGDASVGMHPVTAHGFNLGLRGQATLAGEVRNALDKGMDIGASTLLKNYQSKHRRATRPLYLATNGIVRLYTNDRFPARVMRKAVLRLSNNLRPLKQTIMNQLTESGGRDQPEYQA